ncbi:sucrose phosphorylase [Demequina sp. SYSU T00039]|uniref:Sucrose phosphorylase n=1 Tax=Demequina lignilytica TaxID=3051663 RepID=A0AAW7M7N1_9MICO|nr:MULTISPECIES: sucrose phosphorylase [unclassified Demequina]MDN4479020.1 sucrose phosphorylase [Demequina sp. SYSU T00039-1]MDN4489061.1 sucrose phosphorylase [Demequina sp. SYSU T00039]
MVRNGVQLITYADRLAGDLPGLARLLTSEPWARAFSGVHILPFFTPFDGADAGFDPVDHTAVDPRLGVWEDVAGIGADGDLIVDIIVNHVSADSAAFRDWRARGRDSDANGMFLTLSSVFPEGASESQLARIYRPRPGLPFTPITVAGERRLVWTTFTPQQIDIDVAHPRSRAYLDSILDAVARAGVAMVRLDAVGYAIKTPGTTCFMTDATFEFIADFTERARARGVEVLVEVHSYFRRQIEIGRSVDRVYDFGLPPLVLHALHTGDGGPLVEWFRVRPANAVTVLDTHDGIGVIDVGADEPAEGSPGLLPPAALDALVETIHEASGGSSRLATGAAASNLDLYQVNCTYYDALGADDRAYLAARAIQFFTPGIPQVYYVGALAGRNDVELLGATGVGRDINRAYYGAHDVERELARPVVRALMALCAWRTAMPVFDGAFRFSLDDAVLTMAWQAGSDSATLAVDLRSRAVRLGWEVDGVAGETTDLLADPPRLSPAGP